MLFFWVVLWLMLPLLALSSGPDCCALHESSSSHSVSPLLQSLQCHNNYDSYVQCKWRKHSKTPVELWFQTEDGSCNHHPCMRLCKPNSPRVQDELGMVQCEYETRAFTFAINHTAFFRNKETGTICFPVPHKPLDLSLHLKARSPVNLSTHDEGDGGRWLWWSSPYPSNSSMNKVLTYQLSYRTDGQDNWTTEDVTDTRMKIEKRFLLPGYRYEAKVRARANVGQWSDWSPVETWKTEEDTGQPPSLHCVLDGEEEVMCSWEVRTELAHIITYQLACRHNKTVPSERCCVNPRVTHGLDGTVLRYSCSLTVTDPAHLLLDLVPTHNAKTFNLSQHIRPERPRHVTVRENDGNWIVEWTQSSTASEVKLSYQVCYYSIEDQRPPVLLNISAGSLSVHILGTHLVPCQQYQVRVRALVAPGSDYNGVPSEWSDPEVWTSLPHSNPLTDTWSFTTTIYVIITVVVAIVFFTLYYSIPACQRRVILWVDSVPSPGKSKIMSEIKSTTTQAVIESEDTSICKDLHFDTISTCSSNASLWPIKDTDKHSLEVDEGCWNCGNLPASAEKVHISNTSSISFSGPYIFCQTSEAKSSVEAKCEEKQRESSSNKSPSPVNSALYGDGYVCLPSRTASRSTQDLASHSETTTNTQRHGVTEQDQQSSGTTPWPDETDQTSSTPFISWPQGGNLHASGYCHLPQH